MTATDTRGAVPFAALGDLSVDELGRAIAKHERGMNAQSYRALLLVRAFDERYGWAKWGCASCAEWLVWSCGLSLSAARERVRTANALRAAGDLGRARRRAALVYEGSRAHARGRGTRRGSAARVCAERVGAASRGALSPNPQRNARVGRRRAAGVGASIAQALPRFRARTPL